MPARASAINNLILHESVGNWIVATFCVLQKKLLETGRWMISLGEIESRVFFAYYFLMKRHNELVSSCKLFIGVKFYILQLCRRQ